MSDLEATLLLHLHAAGLPTPVTQFRFHPPRRWRFDLCFPAHRLAVEVDGGTWVGGRHSRGAGYERDCLKLNQAVIDGWRVLRVTGDMVRDGRALAAIEQALGGKNDEPVTAVHHRN